MLYQAAYLQPFMIQAARSCKCCPPSSWRWGVAPLGWESRRGSLRTLHPPEPPGPATSAHFVGSLIAGVWKIRLRPTANHSLAPPR